MPSFAFYLLVLLSVVFPSKSFAGGSSYEEQLLTELMLAEPGDVIEMPEGRHLITADLSLLTNKVTLRGQGAGKTILAFDSQTSGAQGLYVSANEILLEDFAVENAKGDGIKIYRSDRVTMRRLHVRWTRGPHHDNGGYGLYPVLSKNVLVVN